MLADIALRHRDYAERELYDPRGRYGDVRWPAVVLLVVGTVLGWGLVTNTTAELLSWQGYLLGPVGLGGREGAWAFANLGVLVALLVGFVGRLLLRPAAGARRRRPLTGRRRRLARRGRHAAVFADAGSAVGHTRLRRGSCRPSRRLVAAFGEP